MFEPDIYSSSMATWLAGFGLLIELAGFGWAGWSVRSAWKTANPDERFWFPGKNRNIVVVDAAAAMEFSVTVKTRVVLPDDAETEQKIAWLVDRVHDLQVNAEAHAEKMEQQLRELKAESDQRIDAVGSEIANAAAQYRRDTIADLRDAGRGVLLAVIGLGLQVPALF